MRVAVLGGGITGVCAALELSERGLTVDLYEQDAQVISRASYWNEGKIHLGLVYAKDQSRKSGQTMIEGALRFRPLLARWIETNALDRALSDPFVYAVHHNTLIPPAAIEEHFRAVTELCRFMSQQPGTEYIAPLEGRIWRRNDIGTNSALFDDGQIIASYTTEEHSIDPLVIAAHLRTAVASAPNVTIITNTTVKKITHLRRKEFTVVSENGEGTQNETYGAVINALWQNRIGIDATLGLEDTRPVLHRFKVGLHTKHTFAPSDLPTVTFILGPFGDTVNFGHRAYLSWYPAGHLLTSSEKVPSTLDSDILNSDLHHVEVETLEALGHLIPGQQMSLRQSAGLWEIGGGYITAWGITGIEDRHSQLHERFEIGVHTTGSYHSVDTGKYTLAPYLANIVCNRLIPKKSVVRPLRMMKR